MLDGTEANELMPRYASDTLDVEDVLDVGDGPACILVESLLDDLRRSPKPGSAGSIETP
jgi:hypothetical protein